MMKYQDEVEDEDENEELIDLEKCDAESEKSNWLITITRNSWAVWYLSDIMCEEKKKRVVLDCRCGGDIGKCDRTKFSFISRLVVNEGLAPLSCQQRWSPTARPEPHLVLLYVNLISGNANSLYYYFPLQQTIPRYLSAN